jgi:hypothetical protein
MMDHSTAQKRDTMFQTTFLPDAVFLVVKRCTLAAVQANGSGFATFAFDLTEADARALLESPDAALCRTYHKTWRDIRRRLDSVQAAGVGQ